MLKAIIFFNLLIFSINGFSQFIPFAMWGRQGKTPMGYSATRSAGNASLVGAAGMTQIKNVSEDDSYYTVVFSWFNFYLAGSAQMIWYLSSNTYINTEQPSTAWSGLSASNPPYPKFHFGAADNSWQRVWITQGFNFFRVRYEGTASTGGTVGSPNIVYEATFFRPTSTAQYVQVVFGTHSRNTGQFGVTNASAYYATGGTITANSSYVFEGNLSGTAWNIYPNSQITGTDLNL